MPAALLPCTAADAPTLACPPSHSLCSVGKGSKALLSGGPKSAGPNSVAFSTWWGITA